MALSKLGMDTGGMGDSEGTGEGEASGEARQLGRYILCRACVSDLEGRAVSVSRGSRWRWGSMERVECDRRGFGVAKAWQQEAECPVRVQEELGAWTRSAAVGKGVGDSGPAVPGCDDSWGLWEADKRNKSGVKPA